MYYFMFILVKTDCFASGVIAFYFLAESSVTICEDKTSTLGTSLAKWSSDITMNRLLLCYML